MSSNRRPSQERRKSGGMFRKWFNTPTKPVMPGGNTYGEPRSVKPTPKPAPRTKSQDELEQRSLTSSESRTSQDLLQRPSNNIKEHPNPAKPLPRQDSSNGNIPRPAASRPSTDSRPSMQTRPSNQYTSTTARAQEPSQTNSSYLSRTSTVRSQLDGPDDNVVEPPPPAMNNELEELKSRIRNLEMTQRQSIHRASSQVQNVPDRPASSNTIVSTSHPRNIPTSPMHEMRSPSYFSKSQSLLQSALNKAENRVTRDVFIALEAAAQDAMDLASLSSTSGATAIYSSSYVPDKAPIDKRFRRTADNLCRSLTELCIALCEDATPIDFQSEARMSMRSPSRESLYQQSQSGMGGTYGRNATREGSVLAARNARNADLSFDDGLSSASRQASRLRAGSQSTITMDNPLSDKGFRFDDDDKGIRRPGSVSYTSPNVTTNTDRTRSLTLNPSYSNMSLGGKDRRSDGPSISHMHALTSDRAEMRSPLHDQERRSQRFLQPQSASTSHQDRGNHGNDIYELPTHSPSPLPYHDQAKQRGDHHSYSNSSISNNRHTTSPLATQYTPSNDPKYPFSPPPSATKPTTTPPPATSSAIPIPTRNTPTSPLSSSVGGAGSYSSTLTQKIMERRMQQARESQTALSSTPVYGTSLPLGQVGGTGSLLNGLPSAVNGSAGTRAKSGSIGQSDAGMAKLGTTSMSNRSAPRVGLLKPKGYREGVTGFGGGVTG